MTSAISTKLSICFNTYEKNFSHRPGLETLLNPNSLYSLHVDVDNIYPICRYDDQTITQTSSCMPGYASVVVSDSTVNKRNKIC